MIGTLCFFLHRPNHQKITPKYTIWQFHPLITNWSLKCFKCICTKLFIISVTIFVTIHFYYNPATFRAAKRCLGQQSGHQLNPSLIKAEDCCACYPVLHGFDFFQINLLHETDAPFLILS